jgi:hypothetical protein
MLAVAVSQTIHKDILRDHGRYILELEMGERIQQNAEKYGSNALTRSPPAAEKSVANKKAAQAE